MKKLSTKIKKVALLSLTAILVLTGCSGDNNAQGEGEQTKLKIGTTQILDHPSLNAAREGFEERLTELGIDYEVDYQVAGGDVPTAQLIAENFVANNVDLIYAISTPSAQAAQNAAKDKGIPIVFTAVTDAISAGLATEGQNSDYITGILDATTDDNIEQLLLAAKELKDTKNTTSVIYHTGEANSIAQVEQLKRVAESIDMKVEAIGIAALTDIDQALEVASTKSDSLFLISDNLLASAMDLVAQKANDKGLVTVTPIIAYVENSGAVLAIGIDYKQLGMDSADLAKQILVDKKPVSEIPISVPPTLYTALNQATMDKLGLDKDGLTIDLSEAIIIE